VRRLLRRDSRARETAVRKKEPLLIEQLPAILMAIPDDQLATRDRALLLLGYAGAFRRSELVGTRCRAAAGVPRMDRSRKNDPRKKGRELFVPRLPATSPKVELCAVTALERWLTIVGPTGPVFRTFDLRGQLTAARLDPGDVARILRRRTATAGVAGDFAGHFAATRIHHERREEEDPDREHQAGYRPAQQRDRRCSKSSDYGERVASRIKPGQSGICRPPARSSAYDLTKNAWPLRPSPSVASSATTQSR